MYMDPTEYLKEASSCIDRQETLDSLKFMQENSDIGLNMTEAIRQKAIHEINMRRCKVVGSLAWPAASHGQDEKIKIGGLDFDPTCRTLYALMSNLEIAWL